MRERYSGRDICVLVPTKDRPDHLAQLLRSLVVQEERVGRVIVVASGEDIQSTVDQFADALPLEYYHTSQGGQIRQRNLGIGKLDTRTALVACLDDDIVVAPQSMREMVKFWNAAPEDTAGVGFNIVNGRAHQPTVLRRLLGLDAKTPGRVLRSGATSSLTHVTESIRTEWLTGGTTVWRAEVLLRQSHKEIDTRWAIAEDLIFSYPIGKRAPLFICATAPVDHNHHPYGSTDLRWHYRHGRTQSVWVYHFVSSHKELSLTGYFVALGMRIAGKALLGVLTGRRAALGFAAGALSGVGVIVRQAISGAANRDVRELSEGR